MKNEILKEHVCVKTTKLRSRTYIPPNSLLLK